MCLKVVAGSVDETIKSISHWVSCLAEKIYIPLCFIGVFSALQALFPSEGKGHDDDDDDFPRCMYQRQGFGKLKNLRIDSRTFFNYCNFREGFFSFAENLFIAKTNDS